MTLRRAAAAVVAASTLGVSAGCSSASPPPAGPATFVMAGKIEPYAGTFPGQPSASFGPDGKPDLNIPHKGAACTAKAELVTAGDSVVVTDASGKIIGLTALAPGTYENDQYASFCRFTFAVAVPDTSDFYGVQIAQQPVVTFTRADAVAPTFSIGGTPHGTP